ncbi:TetR/AcrR family transcriptional regulator [Conexibacter stalactiti]|uniref:TetR/AcrR family transcriptional regulator n=1 Tax=Conexibacter stalactiti TaxID=1940611 RepID=A0ABU4HLD0_9ACTN|nr:TetR/AcrR family transcriptional regulator [Conexibacter stalactiti]MDW5594115.1 TetR/AcrR family transcriptional regulator [Conexibacter stalactiti]MEC5034757.1 TetR/AcrR family transcriptional regulator [Conexibacter stalactiti]
MLDAASRLFYERGVQAVGMDALREAAGVSLKRIYGLYPSKEALVEAALIAREQGVLAELSSRSGAAAAPAQQILALFDLLGEWFVAPGYRGCAYLNAFGELGESAPRVAGVVRRHKRAWRDLLAERVAEAGGSPRLADQLALLINGAMTSAALGDPRAVAADARAVAEVLLQQGISGP